ncbi:MAG: site-2 protease family protein, partial [Chloroflexota bacterium]
LMGLFQIPPQTRYDLNFTLFNIPIRVHPLFWLIALLFGASAGSLPGVIIWILVVFISILIHELGHSLMMKAFEQDSFIVLHGFGGLAVPTSSRWGPVALNSNQQIMISLAGPFAGFLLAFAVLAVVGALGGVITSTLFLGFIPFPIAGFPNGGLINSVIGALLWVNIFWGLINLVPIFPLDGGQVARELFIKADPWGGVRKSLWLSVISGATVALVGFVYLNSIYMALLFGLLAFQNYQMLQSGGGRMF